MSKLILGVGSPVNNGGGGSSFPGMSAMTWTGASGDVFDLLGDDDRGVLMGRGATGLYFPPVERFVSISAGVDGSRWRGWRAKERPVFWPLVVTTIDSSLEWVQRDRALWATFRPDTLGQWAVTQPSGETRRLMLRFTDDGNFASMIDPSFVGTVVYGLNFVAESPYWVGDPVSASFQQPDQRPFFNKPQGLWISSSATIGSATVSNPGDVAAYPVWTVYGPTTSVNVGVGGAVDELHFPIAAGKAVVLDTNPTVRTCWGATVVTALDGSTSVVLDGTDRTNELGAVSFAPIDPGKDVPLSLALTGTGKVQVAFEPYYFGAW